MVGRRSPLDTHYSRYLYSGQIREQGDHLRKPTLRTSHSSSSMDESPYESNQRSASCEEREESYDGFARPTRHCDTWEM